MNANIDKKQKQFDEKATPLKAFELIDDNIDDTELIQLIEQICIGEIILLYNFIMFCLQINSTWNF